MEKQFVGRCKLGKYPDQIEIGWTQADIDKLQASLNTNGTGWTNTRLNKGKDSGKPYMEIVTKSNLQSVTNNKPSQPTQSDDLPF